MQKVGRMARDGTCTYIYIVDGGIYVLFMPRESAQSVTAAAISGYRGYTAAVQRAQYDGLSVVQICSLFGCSECSEKYHHVNISYECGPVDPIFSMRNDVLKFRTVQIIKFI